MENHKEAYINFCKQESDLPIFSQVWYLDAVCGTNGWDILLAKKGNEIAATMPIPKSKNIWGFQVSRMPILTKYLGPNFSNKYRNTKHEEKLLKELILQIPSHHFFQHTLHPSLKNWLPFLWKNFNANVLYTYTLDLQQDLKELYNNIDANYRNNKIKNAEKKITIHSNLSLLDFYTLKTKTQQRQDISFPFSFSFFEKYDAVLQQNNARKIFFAVDEENNIHSTAYLIWDEKTAYLQMIGDDPNLRQSGAGILLTWHTIKYAKEVLQKERYDFLGSMLEPITNVRQSFGATQKPYFQIQKFSRLWMKTAYESKKIIGS